MCKVLTKISRLDIFKTGYNRFVCALQVTPEELQLLYPDDSVVAHSVYKISGGEGKFEYHIFAQSDQNNMPLSAGARKFGSLGHLL